MLFGLIKDKDRKGKGVDRGDARRIASDGIVPLSAKRERRRTLSHSTGQADTDTRRRSFFGRLWDHTHTHKTEYDQPPDRLVPASPEVTKLLAPPKKKKEMTSLKEAAKAMPALTEESEPPSPISQRGLLDLAEILAEPSQKPKRKGWTQGQTSEPISTEPTQSASQPATPDTTPSQPATPDTTPQTPTPDATAQPPTPDATPQPPTPPATPLMPETRTRVVDQLAPVLEMDHALALAQAIFEDPSASTSTSTSDSSTPETTSRAEPATPPATPMPPIERDFAFQSLQSPLIPSDPPREPPLNLPLNLPLSPLPTPSQPPPSPPLHPPHPFEHRLSALDMETLKDEDEAEDEDEEKKQPPTPPTTPATPPPRGGSRQWRLSVIPPEWHGIESAIAAAIEPQTLRETAAENGVGNGNGVVEKKIRRKPVTLVPADEEHVATAMAESIQRQRIQPDRPLSVLDNSSNSTDSPKDAHLDAPSGSSSSLKQRVPSTHALNPPPKAPVAAAVVSDGWRVPRVRAPPGSRRSRMFGIGG
ncbi:hypothetical protein CcaverHIS002_0703110 [Cutaneotrichosporon cavernicola]|nr:hypothetical protein CcaverHIS002_0703110 [Cutaneotrichosporon cavernicola]